MSFYVSNKHRVCNKSEKNDRCLAIFFTSNSSPKATEELAVRASRASATLVLCDMQSYAYMLAKSDSLQEYSKTIAVGCMCMPPSITYSKNSSCLLSLPHSSYNINVPHLYPSALVQGLT